MTTPEPELPEKDFINEGYKKNPFPFWLWLFLITALAAVFWGSHHWYSDKINNIFSSSPFLQVTNRELSLFLWQNPEFMRANAKQKSGYLTAFRYLDKVTVEPFQADEYAVGPPELLFRYHTWKRLLGDYFIPLAIPTKDFRNFLTYVQEWQPAYWPAAPKAYADMVVNLAKNEEQDLASLPYDVLPIEVRMAFQGWKNYFYDGEAIDKIEPTSEQMQKFLVKYPNYARNFWRNIVEDFAPNYLKDISKDAATKIPNANLAPFLKAALYNYIKKTDAINPGEIDLKT